MKQTVEIYTAFLMLMLFMLLSMAFTSINLHVSQARTLYSSIKAEVQASNGVVVDDSGEFAVSFEDNGCTFEKDGFQVAYIVERVQDSESSIHSYNESWIYNDVYKLTVIYVYNVPFFGRQIYPISGYVY